VMDEPGPPSRLGIPSPSLSEPWPLSGSVFPFRGASVDAMSRADDHRQRATLLRGVTNPDLGLELLSLQGGFVEDFCFLFVWCRTMR
jgi:hypothetical protein